MDHRVLERQEKALRFYSDVLVFKKKAGFSQRQYRWLTVSAPEAPDGVELALESNCNPAAKSYQEALYSRQMRAAQFLVNDVQAEHGGLAAHSGGEVHEARHQGHRVGYHIIVAVPILGYRRGEPRDRSKHKV